MGHYDVALGKFHIELTTGEEIHVTSKHLELLDNDDELDEARRQRDELRHTVEREHRSAELLTSSATLLQRSPVGRRAATAKQVLEEAQAARAGKTTSRPTTRRSPSTFRSRAHEDDVAPLSEANKDSPWAWRPPELDTEMALVGRPPVVSTGSPERAVRPHAGDRYEAMIRGDDVSFSVGGKHAAPRMRRPPAAANGREAAERRRRDLRAQAWDSWTDAGQPGGGWWEIESLATLPNRHVTAA